MNAIEYAEAYGEDMTYAVNDHQRRAEAVAERHLRTGSPEFRSWFSGQYDSDAFASVVVGMVGDHTRKQIALGVLDVIRDDFRTYVCSGPRDLRAEIGREP